jgi:hypothetical protein
MEVMEMEAMAMHVWVVMVVVEDMEAVAMVQAMEVVEDTAVAAMADIVLTAGASFLFQWYVPKCIFIRQIYKKSKQKVLSRNL